jgi:hypothetical protein
MEDEILTGLRAIDQAHATPFKDALTKLGSSGEGFTLEGGRDQAGRTGASLEATKTFGKNKTWSASAAAQWVKDAGYAVMGKLKWTPK